MAGSWLADARSGCVPGSLNSGRSVPTSLPSTSYSLYTATNPAARSLLASCHSLPLGHARRQVGSRVSRPEQLGSSRCGHFAASEYSTQLTAASFSFLASAARLRRNHGGRLIVAGRRVNTAEADVTTNSVQDRDSAVTSCRHSAAVDGLLPKQPIDAALEASAGAGSVSSQPTAAAAGNNSRTMVDSNGSWATNGSPQAPATTPSAPIEPLEQPPEAGIVRDDVIDGLAAKPGGPSTSSSNAKGRRRSRGASASGKGAVGAASAIPSGERSHVKESWAALMRWSRWLRQKDLEGSVMDRTAKVVVFGGGSFGTAIAASLARKKADMNVTLLLRDPYVCQQINRTHRNSKYLQEFELPHNVTATTSVAEAISGAQYAVHAVPVQHTRAFLHSIRDLLPPSIPIISVSKGLEVGSGLMMHELIPSALGRRQPTAFLSGPSFAKEVMAGRPTGLVAAAKDAVLAREVQQLFASNTMRVNLSTDVVGVEICGALKNVLAIAAGIVEGLQLGNNAMAALVAQGCAEIRWLATKMGAKPTTVSGLSGLGDIMLTCYGDLSRNRSVGKRLGSGESLEDILAGSSQVAEGVATASVVVTLARKYKVSLPVLTAVAQVLDAGIEPREAVNQIMSLPQIEER